LLLEIGNVIDSNPSFSLVIAGEMFCKTADEAAFKADYSIYSAFFLIFTAEF
jgi:hypothetical protein